VQVQSDRNETQLNPTLPNKSQAVKLNELRCKIDKIDSEMSVLLQSRLDLVLEIAKLKRALGLPLKVCNREEEILERVSAQAPDEKSCRFITQIYAEILKASRSAQV
jgi:chorismate mutase